MPLDTSIPLQVKAPEFNPLQQALQVAQYRYMNANGLAQQQAVNANRATSDAYQQATDPTTGAVDNNKLVGILSQNPDAAYNLPQVIQGINTQKQQQQTLQRGDIGLNNDRIDNYKKALSFMTQQFSTLQPNDPDFNAKMLKIGSDAVQLGHIDPNMVVSTMAQIPQDPNQRATWFQQKLASMGDALQQLNAKNPQFAQVNTGPATVAVNQNPLAQGGVGAVGYTVQNGLSPSDAASPVTVNANGQPTMITKGQFATGAQGGGAQNTQPGAQGGQPPAQGGAPAIPGQLPGGGFSASPPLGADKIAGDAAARYGNLQQAASQAKPLMQTYDLAAQALQSTITGKGAGAALNVPALLNTFGIQAGSDSLKNNQLLVNYLNSAADQAASSLGLSGSDSRLAAAKAGQPDASNMNAPALLESIQHVKGLQQAVLDRQQATTNFLAQNGNNASTLPQFETKWNQSFNPDVSYVRSLGDPAAQQGAMQKLKAEGKLQQWTKDYQAMKALGAF